MNKNRVHLQACSWTAGVDKSICRVSDGKGSSELSFLPYSVTMCATMPVPLWESPVPGS